MEKKKSFKTGILVGRFQPIHIGHENIINIGLSLCEKLLIFIGSANSDITKKNPMSAEYRINLITKIYEEEVKRESLILDKLDDFDDPNLFTSEWGNYVIDKSTNILGQAPEVIIYGKDKDIFKCFDKETVKNITEILVDRNRIGISATKLREYILLGDKENFEKFTNEKIHNEYENIKKFVESVNKYV